MAGQPGYRLKKAAVDTAEVVHLRVAAARAVGTRAEAAADSWIVVGSRSPASVTARWVGSSAVVVAAEAQHTDLDMRSAASAREQARQQTSAAVAAAVAPALASDHSSCNRQSLDQGRSQPPCVLQSTRHPADTGSARCVGTPAEQIPASCQQQQQPQHPSCHWMGSEAPSLAPIVQKGSVLLHQTLDQSPPTMMCA